MVQGILAQGCHNDVWGFGGGNVEEKMRERMIVAFEKTVRMAGAPSFEKGMCQAKEKLGIASSWVLFVNNFIQPIQTVEDLREALESRMFLPEREQAQLLFALEKLPQIVREGSLMASKRLAATFPPQGGRKRAFTVRESQAVLDYVSQLNRDGASMPAAKDRAAQNFHCSRRTIDRLWKQRKSIPLEEPPTIQELINMVIKTGQADGWQVPVS